MQKKIAVGLALIVLLPLGLLGWFSVRMAHNEQKIIEHLMQTLLTSQLKSVDDALQAYFHSEQKVLLERASNLNEDTGSLRAFVRELPQAHQVLVISHEGKRVFPPMDGPISNTEHQFVERTAAIWENPAILLQDSATNPSQGKPFGRTAQSIEPDALLVRSGWYAWYWNAELHHIFWMRSSANQLIAIELSPARAMTDIIARLPSTGSKEDNLGNALMRLINANGQIIYQWGQYQPKQNEQKLSMLPLSPPLGSWKLEYYGPSLQPVTAANWLSVILAVVAVALALGGLAYYLYREQTREMRLAEQRVNFVNQVSHELKTPLTNIRLYAELLEDELSDQDDKSRKYIGILTGESQRLSRLIANVLSFARIQKERLVLHTQAGRVDATIARCIEAFMPALQNKSITVRFDANAGALVRFDPEALEQILNNLFSNVEKYAASGGAMEISSAQTPNLTTIHVRDFGPGIAKREHERIFQPFYRISSWVTDGVAGTGIGLGIARQLARLHGGDIKLETIGHGTCFQISLLTDPVKEA